MYYMLLTARAEQMPVHLALVYDASLAGAWVLIKLFSSEYWNGWEATLQDVSTLVGAGIVCGIIALAITGTKPPAPTYPLLPALVRPSTYPLLPALVRPSHLSPVASPCSHLPFGFLGDMFSLPSFSRIYTPLVFLKHTHHIRTHVHSLSLTHTNTHIMPSPFLWLSCYICARRLLGVYVHVANTARVCMQGKHTVKNVGTERWT